MFSCDSLSFSPHSLPFCPIDWPTGLGPLLLAQSLTALGFLAFGWARGSACFVVHITIITIIMSVNFKVAQPF